MGHIVIDFILVLKGKLVVDLFYKVYIWSRFYVRIFIYKLESAR